MKIFKKEHFPYGFCRIYLCGMEILSYRTHAPHVINSDTKPKATTKISIIVPVYNVEQFLPQCMDSLINQTLKEIDIICINDGSTDNSEKILQQYAKQDKRIKIITQQNMGLSCARNAGLAVATGEYISFVDSDDWVDTDWCEKLYTAAKKENADIVRATIYNEYSNKTEPHKFNSVINDHIKKHLYLSRKNDRFVIVSNNIYRKNLLTDNHIDFIAGLIHEDIPFTTMTTYYANKIVPINNTFYHYRRNRLGRLSEPGIKSVDGTFMANHYAITFIRSVPYKDYHDYVSAIKRIIWRADKIFINAVKNVDDFTDDLQKKYFRIWRKDLSKCKYKRKYKKEYPWLRYVISGNMKKYIKYRTEN